jgi:lipopolysaccharide/colanic/teichoic acid biosynthesis glycosyltransferase
VIDIHVFIERETGRVEIDLVRPSRVIFADGFPTGTLGKLMHRLFDVSLALLLLVIAAPIMLLVAFCNQAGGRA